MGIADRILSCSRRTQKVWAVSSVQARSVGGGGLCFPALASESLQRGPLGEMEPPLFRSAFTVQLTLRHSLLIGGRKGQAAPFSSTRRCFSSLTPGLSSSPCLMLHPGVDLKDDVKDYFVLSESPSSSSDEGNDFLRFLSFADGGKVVKKEKFFKSRRERELLCPDDARCIGSSHGWLAFMHPRNFSLFLYSPFSSTTTPTAPPYPPFISLPSFETLPSTPTFRVYRDWLYSSTSLTTEFIGSRGCVSVRKLVLSSAPCLPANNNNNDDCIVMAIEGRELANKLAFCKPGGTTWTVLNGSLDAYSDIVYSNKDGRFYAIGESSSEDSMGDVVFIEAWDLSDPSLPKMSLIQSSYTPGEGRQKDEFGRHFYLREPKRYLVESSGDLLLVVRYVLKDVDEDGMPIDDEELRAMLDGSFDPAFRETEDSTNRPRERFYKTNSFEVYKLDFDHKRFEAVDCLGDRALFVGLNHSFSISTGDFPDPDPIGNAIYFTDDHDEEMFHSNSSSYGGHDLGVFHLEVTGVGDYITSDLKKIRPPPIYVVPPVELPPVHAAPQVDEPPPVHVAPPVGPTV